VAEAGEVDGAVVVTPAPHHAQAIEELAPLGVPIFCEKPLVTDPADGQRLLELCGERLFVMHKWRWHPGIEALARLAADGTLGRPAGVRSYRLGWGPFHFRVDSVDTLAPHALPGAGRRLGGLLCAARRGRRTVRRAGLLVGERAPRAAGGGGRLQGLGDAGRPGGG
jgi:hypothetical protein